MTKGKEWGKKKCLVETCAKRAQCRGWCGAHYMRWYEHGDPEWSRPPLMKDSKCCIEGCGEPARAQFMCVTHYKRLEVHGDPLFVTTWRTKFWNKVRSGGPDDCWEWLGYKRGGYGRVSGTDFRTGPTYQRSAHRVAYELMVDEIPEGAELDHQCHNKACVNPSHLYVTDRKRNIENWGEMNINNTSGFRGVSRSASGKRWIAKVCHNGKRHYLGTFASPLEAGLAAKAKRNELHTNNLLDRKAS